MSEQPTFESFAGELQVLVDKFSKGSAEFKGSHYNEAKLRDDFLNPFFEALGWDLRNKAGLIQSKREVEIESPTRIGSGKKRADYLFRADSRDRFVCEAKKPSTPLDKGPVFQAKRYAWNKDLPLAVLTNFEEIKFYIVGARPDSEEPAQGEYKVLHYNQFVAEARFLWDLLGRDNVQGGSIDRLIEGLPKKAAGKGKLRQGYLIKPDRNRALDADFLNFLDVAREELASSLIKHNDRDELLQDKRLNEATQKILDRILFLRICEDRDIDTGVKLQTLADMWKAQTRRELPERKSLLREEPAATKPVPPGPSLYRRIVQHFRELDRRPASAVPFFNGQLFKEHFSEKLEVGDDFLLNLIQDLSDENSPYLFNIIPVEILGSVYERFLGKVVRPQGRGVTVEEKPEVRKAGGVYYTPRYIVDYIVEQTVGKLLDDIAAEKGEEGVKAFSTRTEKLRVLDPACGSGSFLIRAFERVCEHWQKRLTDSLPGREDKEARSAWEKKHRPLCWVDPESNDVHLTVNLKRAILTNNVFGVDLDAAAVEVTQLSLYLKMLENENRTTLEHERELFAEAVALLPPLQDNIKCGNSLIASDFSLDPDDLVRVHAFDWPVQFASIMKAGGFDAVIGNPPYGAMLTESDVEYFRNNYSLQEYQFDTYIAFLERSISLVKRNNYVGMIIPNTWLLNVQMPKIRMHFVSKTTIEEIVHFAEPVFEQATVDTEILVVRAEIPSVSHHVTITYVNRKGVWEKFETAQSRWQKLGGGVINILERPDIANFADRLRTFPKLGDLYKVTQGAKPFQVGKGSPKQTRTVVNEKPFVNERKVDQTFKPLLRGSLMYRYVIEWNNNSWISFGDWLAEPRYSASYDAAEKIVIRQTGDSLIATLDTRQFIVRDNLYTIIPYKTEFNIRVLLGLLNSKLLGWFYQNVINPEVGEALAQVKRSHLDVLPICLFNLKNPADKARHDQLVALVDKMLVLMPKLRAATSEREKETLQNAVDATDQQIDQLVYELYGLTEDEIRLVEESSRKK